MASREIYEELLRRSQDQDKALEEHKLRGEFAPELSESGEPVLTPEELALAEADDTLRSLKVAEKKAQITKSANKLDQDENSDFNLKNKDTNEDVVTDVMDQREDPKNILGGKSEIDPNIRDPFSKPEEVLFKNDADIDTGLKGALADVSNLKDEPSKPAAADQISQLVAGTKKDIPQPKPSDLVKKAMEEKRYKDALAMMSEGFAGIGAGLAGRHGGATFEADNSVADYLRKQGKDELDFAKGERKRADATKKLAAKEKRQAELDDLNRRYKESLILKKGMSKLSVNKDSESSLNAKKRYSKMYPGMDFEGLSEKDIVGEIKNRISNRRIEEYYKPKTEISKAGLEQRERKFGYKQKEKFEVDARNSLKDMRQTETWKVSEKALATIPEIDALLDDAYKTGGQSLAMLGPRVAKGIAGEVGVLTEQDVTRYVKNPALVQGVVDDLQKAKSGKISKASYRNLKRLLDISKKVSQDKLDSAIDRAAILFARREQIPYEDARYFIDNEYTRPQGGSPEIKIDRPTSTEKVSAAPYGDEVTRNGKEYRWNPAVGKYQLK